MTIVGKLKEREEKKGH